MTRFLRRTGTTDTSADDQNTEGSAPLITPETPAGTGLQSPIEPQVKSPSRRGGRRRSSANGSPASKAEAAPANKPAPRRATRRSPQDKPSDPNEKMLALLERQTTLLEQQGKTIERLAESQALLTDTLLGRRGEDHPPGRIEVLPRLAIFVDVPNILYGAESSGVRLNWGKVADFLSHGRTLVRAIAYAADLRRPDAAHRKRALRRALPRSRLSGSRPSR